MAGHGHGQCGRVRARVRTPSWRTCAVTYQPLRSGAPVALWTGTMLLNTSQAVILLPEHDDADARINALFEKALLARKDRSDGGGNLYGGSAGPAAMLAAFRVLIDETPLVRFGHVGANVVIDNATQNDDAIHIVDLGIGHGVQWDDLLRRLAGRKVKPSVRLTGIDLPYASDKPLEALERTGARLSALALSLGIAFSFEPIAAAIETVERPVALPGETLIVNAALALHHVADGDAVTDPTKSRRALLRRLASWKPALLTLIEPDAAHNETAFVQRVSEARRHYGLVFDVLAHLFAQDRIERETLEQAFFGLEILNVIANERDKRVERHDRIDTWCAKLSAAGFAPLSLGGLAKSHTRELGLASPFSVERRGDALALCFRGESVIGVSAWVPA